MKNNIIPFPGVNLSPIDVEDNFYALEEEAMKTIHFGMVDRDKSEVTYGGPEAFTTQFKHVLLEILRRRQREYVRVGQILTVSHPLMESEEQIPLLAERSEVPTITVRTSTEADLEIMTALKDIFPVLADVRNAIRSNQTKRLPGFFV